tara:strand:+ start:1015 stop:1959 length:945 start_codon:yes stop_codon:yes gene_type:complete
MKNLKQLKGDASTRKFFRKKSTNSTSIIIFSKKEKIKNLLVYDAINKILIKNKILAPILYTENYKKNFIEVEDFGNRTILQILKKSKNRFSYFKRVIKLLNQIQSIKDKTVKDFKNKNYKIPNYGRRELIKEANLFCEWYVKKELSKKEGDKFTKKYKKIIKKILSSLKMKNNVFVHRDFHVSNLMFFKNQIGVIDSQDALIGNKAYDLSSLIDDVRLETSTSLKKKIYNFYVKDQKKHEIDKFKNDFEILSVLRNLKIIGIFTRLAVRDKKKSYMKLIPYAWSLIALRVNGNEVFQELKNLLNESFKKKLNEN